MESTKIEAAGQRVTNAGHRYSTGRQAVVKVLEGAERPLTTNEIVERGAKHGLVLSSVYRNLVVLESAGVVERVTGWDDSLRYELAEALTDHHHHHLVCVECGVVSDFEAPPKLERAMQQAVSEVTSTTGFEVRSHRFDLEGICADCTKPRTGSGRGSRKSQPKR